MDWLTFFSKIFEAAAWPSVVVVIVHLLRKPLGDAIRAWETIKATYKEFVLELKRVKAEAEIAALPSAADTSSSSEGSTGSTSASHNGEPLLDKYERLIEISPAAGIVEAWRDVEVELGVLAERHGIETSRGVTFTIISRLEAAAALDARTVEVIQSLRKLRNEAANHTPKRLLAQEDAMDYAMLAARIIARLQENCEGSTEM